VPEGHISSLAEGFIYIYTKHVHKYVKSQIMHIAVLITNTDDSAFAKARPDDRAKFADLLHLLRPDWRVSSYVVKDGIFPNDLSGVDGWIISGSPASVHDADPWVQQLLDLIKRLDAAKAPMFGACFGHQAIAQALGGSVGANPGGWVFGLAETTMEDGKIRLYAAHSEQVLQAPIGAQVIGGNPDCPIGSFAIGQHILTTQYHPEMTPEFISALVDAFGHKLPPEVSIRAKASLSQIAERDRIAEKIVAFFERH
jgi:GMP synthase-like glutamine amidotransferase